MHSVVASARYYLKRHLVLWLVLVFLLILFGGYLLGFRPGPGLTVVRVGTLVVTDIPDGTKVYTDEAARGASSGGKLSAELVPGSHTVIVDPPNDEPVEEIVTIASNQTTTFSPILVPKTPTQTNLSGADAEAAEAAIATTTLPTEDAPLPMGCVDVFTSENSVIAAAATSTPGCTPPPYLCTDGSCAPTVVYAPAAALRSVIAFPGRTDAVIVATGEWVYALGLDPRTPQFFAPIAHGGAPLIASADDTSIYVSDNGNFYKISLNPPVSVQVVQ